MKPQVKPPRLRDSVRVTLLMMFTAPCLAIALMWAPQPTPDVKAFVPNSGGFTVSSGLTIRPRSIRGTVNDYFPTAFGNAALVLQAVDGDATLTGLWAGIDGRAVAICVPTGTLRVEPESGWSEAINRIMTPGSQALEVWANNCVSLVYDEVTTRWRVTSISGWREP